jgi:flagellar basal-body rod protein FlgC
VISDNIANVITDDFKKSRTIISEGPYQTVQPNVQQINTPGLLHEVWRDDALTEVETSNVDLAEEIPQLIITKHAYAANMEALRTYDEVLGTMLDIMG